MAQVQGAQDREYESLLCGRDERGAPLEYGWSDEEGWRWRWRRTEEELAASEEGALTGILTKEDHLLQRDCRSLRERVTES